MKIIKGSQKMLEELQANLFNMLSEEGHELNGSEADGYALKIDEEVFNDNQRRIIEVAMKARINAGVLDPSAYTIDEELVKNSFSLIADSQEKMEIIQTDILRGAKIPEENVIVLLQPWAPEMYSTFSYLVIAFGLSSDQMKAVQLSAKAAKTGLKITQATKKAAMIAGSTGNVVNRVGREVTLAGVEIGATIGAGMVKTGIEAAACAVNIGIRDLNPREIAKGENVQRLGKTIRSLFKKNGESQQITNGFAAL